MGMPWGEPAPDPQQSSTPLPGIVPGSKEDSFPWPWKSTPKPAPIPNQVPTGVTKMFSPEGELADIPNENVDKATQQKFKPAVYMTSPEGELALIHPTKAGAALAQGFKVGPPQQQPKDPNALPDQPKPDWAKNIPYDKPTIKDVQRQQIHRPSFLAATAADDIRNKMVEAGSKAGGEIGEGLLNPDMGSMPAGSKMLEESQKKFKVEHPVLTGVGKGIGKTTGGVVSDPVTWMLAGAGAPAGAVGRTAVAGTFGVQAAKGAYDTAGHLGEIWDDDSISLEDKVAQGTEGVMSALMSAGLLKHAGTHAFTVMSPLLEKVPVGDRPALVAAVNRRLSLGGKAKGAAVSAIAGDVSGNKPLEPAAGPLTHAQVADYMAAKGVEHTPAQALGNTSKPLNAIQAVGERALVGGQPLHDLLTRQKGQVANAVQEFHNQVGNEYTPDAESVGEHLKSQANDRLEKLKAPIDQQLENLRTTATDLNDPSDVGTHLQNQAKTKVAELKAKASADYDTWRNATDRMPFDVDLSEVADKYQRQLTEQAEALKNVPGAYSAPVKELLGKIANVKSDLPTPEATPVIRNSTAQAMRSAYLDIARDQSGNVPSKVQRLASQVAGDISDAMDKSATKAGVGDEWQNANQTYRHLMETYQDSDSPLSKLLGQEDPSKITAQVLQKGRFGGNAQTLQLLQKEGYDLSGVKGQVLRELQAKNGDLSKLNYGNDFLKQLFTPDELAKLNDISGQYRDLAQHPLQKVATGDAQAITNRITAKGRFGGNSRTVRDLAQSGIDLSPVRHQVISDIVQNNFRLTNGGHGLGGYQLPYLKELFEPADLQELLALGRVARLTKFELNPSGTSNVMTAMKQLAGAKSPSLAGGVGGFVAGGPVGAALGMTGTEVVAPWLAAKFSANPLNVARALRRAPNPLVTRGELPEFMRTAALTGKDVPPVSAAADDSVGKISLGDEDPEAPKGFTQGTLRPIMKNGQKIGSLDYSVNGDTMTIHQLKTQAGIQAVMDKMEGNKVDTSQQLSKKEYADLAEQMQQEHPNLKIIEAKRIGGTRGEEGRTVKYPITKLLPKTPMESAPRDLDAELRGAFGQSAEPPTTGDTPQVTQAQKELFPDRKFGELTPPEQSRVMQRAQQIKDQSRRFDPDTGEQSHEPNVPNFMPPDTYVRPVARAGFGRATVPVEERDINNPEVRQDLLSGNKKITAQGVNGPVWYSHLENTINQKLPNKFTADQALGTLRNAGVSADELATLDLKPGEKLTKADVLAAAKKNALQINDVWKHSDDINAEEINSRAYDRAEEDHGIQVGDRISREMYGRPWTELDPDERQDIADSDAYREAIEDHAFGGEYYNESESLDSPRYSEHQLPGGENYRELLLQKPSNHGPDPRWKSSDPFEQRAARVEGHPDDYQSSHWDEPNVLGHIRMNDRTDVDGKKTLFLEELQSDWHQTGRKQGYDTGNVAELRQARDDANYALGKFVQNNPSAERAHGLNWESDNPSVQAARNEYDSLYKASMDAQKALEDGQRGVPDAPFKKDWHALLLKRALREAAEGGYDQMAWTPGDVQNERYDLSKHVDHLNYFVRPTGVYDIQGIKSGRSSIEQENISPDKLADYVGKDVAQKIISGEHDSTKDPGINLPKFFKRTGTISDSDLKVGGSGMRGFYDKIVPDFLNKYAKKWGVKVGTTEVPTEKPILRVKVMRNAEEPGGGLYGVFRNEEPHPIIQFDQARKANEYVKNRNDEPEKVTIPVIKLTPKMRQDILKGQPISELQQPRHPAAGTFLPWAMPERQA